MLKEYKSFFFQWEKHVLKNEDYVGKQSKNIFTVWNANHFIVKFTLFIEWSLYCFSVEFYSNYLNLIWLPLSWPLGGILLEQICMSHVFTYCGHKYFHLVFLAETTQTDNITPSKERLTRISATNSGFSFIIKIILNRILLTVIYCKTDLEICYYMNYYTCNIRGNFNCFEIVFFNFLVINLIKGNKTKSLLLFYNLFW